MEEFGSIEDDYISKEEKLEDKEQSYEALQCEPAWFLNFISGNKNELVNIKFAADYYYSRKSYFEAIKFYKMYLYNNSNLSSTCQRECLEGISRSYMLLHCYCQAQNYAIELHRTSSTIDTYTASLSLLYDCSLCSKRFEDSVNYAKKLIMLHSSNSDIWLKLAFAFSKYYNILFQHLPSQLSKFLDLSNSCKAVNYSLSCECLEVKNKKLCERNISHAVTSLLYAEYHLKSTINSSIGFSYEHNVKIQHRIKDELNTYDLSNFYISNLRENIKQLFTGVKNDGEETNVEFMERAGLKLANAEEVKCLLNDFNDEKFEDTWFFFI